MMKKVVNILLIEDDLLDQVEVKRTLERRGILHRLTIAKNGEEAMNLAEICQRQKLPSPDVILLDLNMPKMNGFELLERFKMDKIWPAAKVFVLTTSDEIGDKERIAPFSISGFITKPLKFESPSSIDAFNLMMDLMNP
jgi:CheY-like chemotaxis protein